MMILIRCILGRILNFERINLRWSASSGIIIEVKVTSAGFILYPPEILGDRGKQT